VYNRHYNNEIFTFEPSGGLINASLVMQDKETDTYWSIMTNEAIKGTRKGTKLKKLPTGTKMKWEDWVAKYPETLVLSVNGKEDASFGYARYFSSNSGFRDIQAKDQRLPDKEAVFAFEFNSQKYAITNEATEGGKFIDLGALKIFLYRQESAAIFYSTYAYKTTGTGFALVNNQWIDVDSKCFFDTERGTFIGKNNVCPERLNGYDTFWYTWSLTNPDTKLLK
jgi:hypothetical protein